MNDTEDDATPGSSAKGRMRRFVYGRRLGPLFYSWLSIIVIALGVYYLDRSMPAFHEVILPLYWALGTAGVIITLRWFRWRTGNRRTADRRRAERRDRSD